MTRTFAVLTAILAASFAVPTKAEANPAWVGAVLMGAGLGGILSFRQATRHAKQLRARATGQDWRQPRRRARFWPLPVDPEQQPARGLTSHCVGTANSAAAVHTAHHLENSPSRGRMTNRVWRGRVRDRVWKNP
jgi:hypothetical protein